MKKHFYRLFALCLALVMTLGVVACGQKPAEGNTPATGNGDKEDITLNVWVQSLVNSKDLLNPEEDWWISKAIKEFQKEYPYVKVELTKQNSGSEAATMFRAGATNGTAPDIAEFWSGSWMTDLEPYAYPVDELLTKEEQAKIWGWESVSLDFNADNKRVAIPINNQTMAGFYYNKEIIQKAGLDFENNAPKTVEELFDACEKIKAAGYTPIIADEGSDHGLIYFVFCYWWVQQTGYETMVKQNKGESKYVDDKGLIKAMELYQQLYSKGYVNTDVAAASDAQSRFLMGTEAAMYAKTSAAAETVYNGLGENAGFIKVGDASANGVMQNKLIGGCGQAFIVSKDTKHPEECAALIKYLNSPEEFVKFKQIRTASVPNVDGVKLEDMGDLNPVAKKIMGWTADTTFYVDNVVDADVISELIRYSCDLLTGAKTPTQVAEAMDAIIAAKK